ELATTVKPETLVIFVEDEAALILTKTLLATHPEGPDLFQRILLHPAGGCSMVQEFAEAAREKKTPYKAFGILDGDQRTSRKTPSLFVPGTKSPEEVVREALPGEQGKWKDLCRKYAETNEEAKVFRDALVARIKAQLAGEPKAQEGPTKETAPAAKEAKPAD